MPDSRRQRGSIFAVGGREAREGNLDVLGRFVACCGGAGARIVLLTAASRDPATRAREYDSAFRAVGAGQVTCLHQEYREECSNPVVLAAVDQADGVFFAGGSQLKLVTTIAGTPLEERLRARHREGLHLGGTSAGASAMSTVMIARGSGRAAACMASVRMCAGLGFLREAIIDQHFRERDRIGRLLAAVLCNPSLLGFGLDEDTAFLLDADGCVTVYGNGTLTIIDGGQLESTNVADVPDTMPAAFAGMRIHALSAGWTYDLATRCVGARAATAELPDIELVEETSGATTAAGWRA